MEYSPPPLFKQGASARAKVVIFSLIALALLIGDSRWSMLGKLRMVVGTALYPLQQVALMPRDAMHGVAGYFVSLRTLEKENFRLKSEQVANAQALQQSQLLAAENAQLRKLLHASERLPVKSLMSEILYDARDAFTRKIIVNRGSSHGVALGQPVIDDTGVVGQITRIFHYTAEASLLTDKDQAIPVQVVRSGLRSVAYGRGQSGELELRFIAANADIQKGDKLVTSGIDGVYPAGLAVAEVAKVETKSSDAFARIFCKPAAGIDRNKQLLILLTETNVPPRPPAEEVKDKKPLPKRPAHKESDKEAAPDKDGAAREAAKEAAKPAAANKPDGAAAAAPKEPQAPKKPAAPADPAVKGPAVNVPPSNGPQPKVAAGLKQPPANAVKPPEVKP